MLDSPDPCVDPVEAGVRPQHVADEVRGGAFAAPDVVLDLADVVLGLTGIRSRRAQVIEHAVLGVFGHALIRPEPRPAVDHPFG